MKLVALGVSAEVVVVVDHQHTRFFACALAEKVCRRQAADSASDHDQVVGFTGRLRRAVGIPCLAIAQAVRISKCSIVIAAHAGESRGVVVRGLLGREGSIALLRKFRRRQRRKRAVTRQNSADSYCRTVQKIPPRNRASHAQFAVPLFISHSRTASRKRSDYRRKMPGRCGTSGRSGTSPLMLVAE